MRNSNDQRRAIDLDKYRNCDTLSRFRCVEVIIMLRTGMLRAEKVEEWFEVLGTLVYLKRDSGIVQFKKTHPSGERESVFKDLKSLWGTYEVVLKEKYQFSTPKMR